MLTSISRLPPRVRQICNIQFFAFLGWFLCPPPFPTPSTLQDKLIVSSNLEHNIHRRNLRENIPPHSPTTFVPSRRRPPLGRRNPRRLLRSPPRILRLPPRKPPPPTLPPRPSTHPRPHAPSLLDHFPHPFWSPHVEYIVYRQCGGGGSYGCECRVMLGFNFMGSVCVDKSMCVTYK